FAHPAPKSWSVLYRRREHRAYTRDAASGQLLDPRSGAHHRLRDLLRRRALLPLRGLSLVGRRRARLRQRRCDARRPGAGRRLHVRVRRCVHDRAARDGRTDDRQDVDGGPRRRRRRNAAAARRGPAPVLRVLRLGGAARDGLPHGRAATRQASPARSDRGQSRGSPPGAAPRANCLTADSSTADAARRVIPTLPLPARNRLASTILAALHDASARQRLAGVAGGDVDETEWLGTEGQGASVLLRQRAESATRALAALPLGVAEPPLTEALAHAAVLFDAGLAFEVHELLEPYWVRAQGEEREALQGLIQI